MIDLNDRPFHEVATISIAATVLLLVAVAGAGLWWALVR